MAACAQPMAACTLAFRAVLTPSVSASLLFFSRPLCEPVKAPGCARTTTPTLSHGRQDMAHLSENQRTGTGGLVVEGPSKLSGVELYSVMLPDMFSPCQFFLLPACRNHRNPLPRPCPLFHRPQQWHHPRSPHRPAAKATQEEHVRVLVTYKGSVAWVGLRVWGWAQPNFLFQLEQIKWRQKKRVCSYLGNILGVCCWLSNQLRKVA